MSDSASLGARLRAHSLVVSLVILAIVLVLVDQLASRFNVAGAPVPTSSFAAGSPIGASPTALPTASPTASPLATPQPDNRPQVVYAAGDIADCPNTVPAVPALVRGSRSLVLALGDIVYPMGALQGFNNCFDPVWGYLKARIRPVPGNHDYETRRAAGYYTYFGALAGNRSQGFYSFDLGWWHIVAINSNCQFIGGCRDGSPQIQWLQADLAAHPAACTLAYWHHPRFSSGDGAAKGRTTSPWEALYAAGADVIVNGHDHDYERFAPQDPAGHVDADGGMREFVVGTGGANLTARVKVARNSEIWTSQWHGLLELTLRQGRYDWRFIAAETGAVIDRGSGRCH